MRQMLKAILVVGGLCMLFSCTTTLPLGNVKPSEMRLLGLQMPEVVSEDVPCEALIRFASDGGGPVRRVCYRWVAETISGRAPSLYYYSTEVQSSRSTNPVGNHWVEDGVRQTSQTFYSEGKDIRNASPGQLAVMIHPQGLKAGYNRLECYCEYESNGLMKETNRVGAAIRVE